MDLRLSRAQPLAPYGKPIPIYSPTVVLRGGVAPYERGTPVGTEARQRECIIRGSIQELAFRVQGLGCRAVRGLHPALPQCRRS